MANTLQNQTRIVLYCDGTTLYFPEHKGDQGNYISYYEETDTERTNPKFFTSQALADTFLDAEETAFKTSAIDNTSFLERGVVSCP